ncbi:hypothetical protein J7E38_22730 [Bacillus sp. ISL-35]|uniref:hypothetical protein n=1 Tax=Bacillus sp. ISL-35 TaxID=2819122 RepID=UPI001BEB7E22|nr:hypothetical protein [Bacillus sp. ISL-35]MBT2681778.1 hypothetical protein [Bacillus sp. ISL-35]MBT2706075.1 hypothetical protein [Chryseobacterium sp. ISL-80]
MLFHYHFWTPFVEETEKFYEDHGFRIVQRIGKYQGEFQNFNPPLKWEDFREKRVLFRIIEARKGSINITFGYGKKVMFDHIGFLVSEKEQETICKNAEKMDWKVDCGQRRTFITTPYDFRIELQTHEDLVDSMDAKIETLTVETKIEGLADDILNLFGKSVNHLHTIIGNAVTIREAVMENFPVKQAEDPNGVRIFSRGAQ